VRREPSKNYGLRYDLAVAGPELIFIDGDVPGSLGLESFQTRVFWVG
jgi:hypothetical protein